MTIPPEKIVAELPKPFRLNDIEVVPSQNTLAGQQTTVTVEPRIMLILCLLARHAPEVVSRDDLIAGIWGAEHGADDSVNQAISALRKALKRAGGPNDYIQTVPKRGYRLLPSVEPSAAPAATTAPVSVSGEKTAAVPPWGLAAGILMLVIAAIGFFQYKFNSSPSEPDGQIHSVAVLPFTSITKHNDDNFFAAGMHEALLTSLQKVQSFRVTSRTSSLQFADSKLSIPQIASNLGVSWIVEGTVVQEGDQIRINAKLIDGATDTQVWAEQYKRQNDEILSLQNELATSIAQAVHIELSDDEQARLTDEITINPKAYSAYIRGLHHFDRITPADFERSVEYFKEASALEPNFPQPYAALVVAHGIAVEYGWRSRAATRAIVESAATNAQRTGPDQAETHHALASLAFHYDRDFTIAEREFRRAIDLDHDAYTYFSYGWLLSQLGRHDEAVQALSQAVELDPRSPAMYTDLGWWLYGSGKYEQAIAQADKALEIFDQHPEAHWLHAAALSATGQHEKATAAFNRYESLYGSPVHWFRGYLQALSGDHEAALQSAAVLDKQIEQGQALPIDAALVHIALGDAESTLSIIEQSTEASVSFQPFLWPEYERLWGDSRFQAALTRFGLPQPPNFQGE